MKNLLLCFSIIVFAALSSDGALYSIEYGVGASPFEYRPPTTNYQVEATGVPNQQGIHGFVVHHDGTDTYVDIPVECYYMNGVVVNDLGQVSGTYNANYGGYGCTSFFWDQGQFTIFDSGIWSDPHVWDMNNLGQVIGRWGDAPPLGFVWDHGAYTTIRMTDYMQSAEYNGETYSVDGIATQATAINDRGQVAGYFAALDSKFNYVGFWYIATPVPEPGTMALLCLGLVGLVRIRRKC
jgi:hypothetical protein